MSVGRGGKSPSSSTVPPHVEAVVDIDEHPAPLLGRDGVHAVLASFPLRPLQPARICPTGGHGSGNVRNPSNPEICPPAREIPQAAAAVGEAPAERGHDASHAARGDGTSARGRGPDMSAASRGPERNPPRRARRSIPTGTSGPVAVARQRRTRSSRTRTRRQRPTTPWSRPTAGEAQMWRAGWRRWR
jgi:hypothetical protein